MSSRSEALQRRFVDFGVSVSALTTRLPRNPPGQNLSRQLARAAMAPAGLYSEARDAESTLDYVHKVKVCVKELREVTIWLEMASRISRANFGIEPLARECNELTAIMVTCLKKARANPRRTGKAE